MLHNFSLTSEDLFTKIPDGKRILFNVDFILNSKFFKKYQLIFNSDSNLISYYVNPKDININRKEEKINNKDNKGIKMYIMIFLIILAFVVGIILGRVLCIKYNRKMRANESEDNFSYNTNDSLNDDNKQEFINNNNSKNKYYLLY